MCFHDNTIYCLPVAVLLVVWRLPIIVAKNTKKSIWFTLILVYMLYSSSWTLAKEKQIGEKDKCVKRVCHHGSIHLYTSHSNSSSVLWFWPNLSNFFDIIYCFDALTHNWYILWPWLRTGIIVATCDLARNRFVAKDRWHSRKAENRRTSWNP